MKRNTSNRNYDASVPHRVKTVNRSYKISTQTDYHIKKLARITGTSEGRVIDKIMRAYLLSLDDSYNRMDEH